MIALFRRLSLVAISSLFMAAGCSQTNQVTNEDKAAAKVGNDFDAIQVVKIERSEEEWRSLLSAEEFRILREHGTERAFTGKYWDNKKSGVYHCSGCQLPLFTSSTKFRSGTGWPSFWQPIRAEFIEEKTDRSYGMVRTEVLCGQCGGHLGHVFNDGPQPTGLRYCINGNILNFKEEVE